MELPPDWAFAPLKRIARFGYGDALAADDRTAGNIEVYGSNGPFDSHSSANTLAPCIIVGRKGSYGKIQFSEAPVFAVDTTFVVDRRHTAAHLRFLYYLFGVLGLDELSDDTAVPGLSREKAYQSLCPLPPLVTQRRIARFVDEKTARIDALIEKKRTLLDLLAEKRQALITHAVTKGLDPTAPMKPSGIDWLGDIPAHWEVLRLKFVASEPLSYGANAAAEFDEPEWPRFVRITDVDELGRLRDQTFRSLPPEAANGYLLKPNDILLARSGATVGKSFIYNESWGVACYAGYLIRARIHKNHDARYFYWFLNSNFYREWVRSNFIQSTIQNINADRYANFQIAHPSDKSEQQQIVKFIESSCVKIDTQWKKITRSVERLEEYRAAMITAAVTGQIAELR